MLTLSRIREEKRKLTIVGWEGGRCNQCHTAFCHPLVQEGQQPHCIQIKYNLNHFTEKDNCNIKLTRLQGHFNYVIITQFKWDKMGKIDYIHLIRINICKYTLASNFIAYTFDNTGVSKLTGISLVSSIHYSYMRENPLKSIKTLHSTPNNTVTTK